MECAKVTPDLSDAEIQKAVARVAACSDPEELVNLYRRNAEHPQLEKTVKARLAEIDGGWLLDELGGLRRPYTPEQMAKAQEEFASMESEAIVRELLAEWYFFHPDALPLAEARLVELEEEA